MNDCSENRVLYAENFVSSQSTLSTLTRVCIVTESSILRHFLKK